MNALRTLTVQEFRGKPDIVVLGRAILHGGIFLRHVDIATKVSQNITWTEGLRAVHLSFKGIGRLDQKKQYYSSHDAVLIPSLI